MITKPITRSITEEITSTLTGRSMSSALPANALLLENNTPLLLENGTYLTTEA